MLIQEFCKERGRDIVVFDLEIKKEIGKNGIGWTSFDKMGISVGVTYSFLKNEYKVFMDDNLVEMGELLSSAGMTTGFNTISFDLNLLAGNLLSVATQKTNLARKNYDCLVHSRQASNREGFIPGFKLDEHLFHIFGKEFMKTGEGASAPIWWGEGKTGKVISYCIDDVKREAMLFEHFWTQKWTKTSHGQFNLKTTPQEFFTNLEAK